MEAAGPAPVSVQSIEDSMGTMTLDEYGANPASTRRRSSRVSEEGDENSPPPARAEVSMDIRCFEFRLTWEVSVIQPRSLEGAGKTVMYTTG